MGKHIKYTTETRKKAVEMYKVGTSVSEIVNELKIKDRRRVYTWIGRYNDGDTDFVDKRGKRSIGRPLAIKDKSEMIKDEYIAFLEMGNDILKSIAKWRSINKI